MEYRELGRTGLTVSALGFGCGAVGGLLVKGDPDEMLRVVERAIEAGITYFDTARSYGDGRSEANLGRVLEELDADVLVGTKVDLRTEELDDVEGSIIASVEGSLKRLRRDRVDLIQLHNRVAHRRQPERGWLDLDDVRAALAAFGKLRQQGKVRHYGVNGLGDTRALHDLVRMGQAETIQCPFNLLNPSAGVMLPAGYPFQDYDLLIDRAVEEGMGVLAIRVLAGGALAGDLARHPNAAEQVGPIATSDTYVQDVALARRFGVLVDEGYAGSLVEAAIRFAIGQAGISTVLVGISNMEQLEQALAYVERGPLPQAALEKLEEIWSKLAAV